MEEFVFKQGHKNRGYAVIDDQLGQEPYNMLTARNGERYVSTTWKTTLEQLWAINNVLPEKGRYKFDPEFKYEGQHFSRRDIYMEPRFRADLIKLLRDQFRDMGYPRVYTDVLDKYDHQRSKEYETLLVKVKVNV